MSTPSGVLRAEMCLRSMAGRGLPPRGSFEDRILQEMLVRERRRDIATQVYQAQLTAAGLRIPPALFDLWTSVYVDEVSHDNYRPAVVARKQQLLGVFDRNRRAQSNLVKRAESYGIQSSDQLEPYSSAELEGIKERLRRRAVANATRPISS